MNSNCTNINGTNSSDFTGNNRQSHQKDDLGGIITMGFLILFSLLWGIGFCIHQIYVIIISRMSREITKKPFVPKWLGPTGPVRKQEVLECGVRVETRRYRIQMVGDRTGVWEKKQEAIKWIRKIIKKKYGLNEGRRARVYIPDNACLIQVPMINFKCGQTCTDFEPINGVTPGSYFTYQVCGNERLQITRYVENDVTYVAGFCVYIKYAYESTKYHSNKFINQCFKSRRYLPEPLNLPLLSDELFPLYTPTTVIHELPREEEQIQEEPMDEASLLEAREDEARVIIQSLKSHYCELKKFPVHIGLDDGVVRHFHWDIFTKSFETVDCASCKNQKLEDNPPPYHLLDV